MPSDVRSSRPNRFRQFTGPCRSLIRNLVFLAIVIFSADQADRSLQAAETVGIATTSGHVFVGHVDDHSDDSVLCLRIEKPGIVLQRNISWTDVIMARVDAQELT